MVVLKKKYELRTEGTERLEIIVSVVKLQWRKPYFISPMVSIRASSLFLYCSIHALFFFLCFLCGK